MEIHHFLSFLFSNLDCGYWLIGRLYNEYRKMYRGYSNFLLNMAFISPSEVENIYIS